MSSIVRTKAPGAAWGTSVEPEASAAVVTADSLVLAANSWLAWSFSPALIDDTFALIQDSTPTGTLIPVTDVSTPFTGIILDIENAATGNVATSLYVAVYDTSLNLLAVSNNYAAPIRTALGTAFIPFTDPFTLDDPQNVYGYLSQEGSFGTKNPTFGRRNSIFLAGGQPLSTTFEGTPQATPPAVFNSLNANNDFVWMALAAL